ncbi:hypothetical protein [Pseudotamlana agarivorans]|uniref:hypothetical protein n=1 Tax=Pseudotamlana agarivorans TaxID=481183 RepID=UPI000A8E7FAA|nr:hypothetical protein [Tamlana agarivorans]
MRLTFKDYIATLIFISIISIKAFGFHALSHIEGHDFNHEDHHTDCITCHLIITHQLTLIHTSSGLELSKLLDDSIFVEQVISKPYSNSFVNKSISNQPFCRPPPSLPL